MGEDKKNIPNLTIKEIFLKSARSGIAGASAMVVQVTTLMWMRTIMNFQYRYKIKKYFFIQNIFKIKYCRYGGTISGTVSKLYAEGGVFRFYKGYPVALVQGPISRFGDTFSNTLFLTFMGNFKQSRNIPVLIQTMGSSITAGLFRILLVPVDTLKTILQVEGKNAMKILNNKYSQGGIRVFFHGALASAGATTVGHYPWFSTYNFLNASLPQYTERRDKLLRQALIGFTSSIVSDTVSNSLRVVKTTKQTSKDVLNYKQTVQNIVEKDGLLGLFGRGLKIRIITNGISGLLFSVMWKLFSDSFEKKSSPPSQEPKNNSNSQNSPSLAQSQVDSKERK